MKQSPRYPESSFGKESVSSFFFLFFFITQCSALLLSVQSTKPQQQSLPNKSLQPISDGCVFEKQKLRTYLCVNQCRVLALWFFPLPPDNALMFCWSFCTHTHTHTLQARVYDKHKEDAQRRETGKKENKGILEEKGRKREQNKDSRLKWHFFLFSFFLFCFAIRNKIVGINFWFNPPPLALVPWVCVGVLTDLVLPQFRDWLQKNTLSNYLERTPGHWESHYIVTTPPTHTHGRKYTTEWKETKK